MADSSAEPTSHSGMPIKWQAWKADTAWGRAAGSAKPGRQTRSKMEVSKSDRNKRILPVSKILPTSFPCLYYISVSILIFALTNSLAIL